MILHKENTVRAELLYKSISDVAVEEKQYGNSVLNNSEVQMLEKYSYFIQNLMAFEQEVKQDSNIKVLIGHFISYLKRIIPVKDATLMFYDDVDNILVPVNKHQNSNIVKAMNNFNKEGIFKTIFSDKTSITVPDLESYNSKGPKLHYLILPVYNEKSNYGILSVLTSLGKENITELEKKNINILLNILLGKLEKIKLTEKLNETYDELQTYQAKLSNDFRLSAIGEMTEGIIEDIATPLQVIVSNVDILSEETDSSFELKQIKSQTKKINRVINRLAKFADVNQKNVKIKPCNINTIIKEYFQLVKSTLENANMEYILDFDNDLPPILSHPNYIYQLLTNIFSLLKSFKADKGGIILQTRFKEDNIYLRAISTVKINSSLTSEGENDQSGLAVKIIKNLMKKHEGAVEIDSFNNGSTAISLRFPLKRKIRR
jgi:nitrogen-specific signal transduction histidine kinase